MNNSWLIYGANGYTGELISREAVNKKYKPVLAGRSKEKLIPLAEELELEHVIFDLSDHDRVREILNDYDLILNAAGPFKYTSKPIVEACLKTETHYLDITGEVPIFEDNFKFDELARDNNVAIISGVGFDVVPTDCMANYISDKVSNPTHLEIGVAGLTSLSRGTLKTMIEYLPVGNLVRTNGILENSKFSGSFNKIRFYDKERDVMPVTWGDLATAYRTTGIPNIITYMPMNKNFLSMLNQGKSNDKGATEKNKMKDTLNWIEKNIYGPDEEARLKGKAQIWVQASNEKGEKAEAWLETIEPYRFTYLSGIKSVERIFETNPKGALTPSLAFGKDFILEFPDTRRFDSLN